MKPERFGYVWTGKFDLNKLSVDGNIFESGKKKFRIKKYPDTCGRGLRDIKKSLLSLHRSIFERLLSQPRYTTED